jgi:hypothetical protein
MNPIEHFTMQWQLSEHLLVLRKDLLQDVLDALWIIG